MSTSLALTAPPSLRMLANDSGERAIARVPDSAVRERLAEDRETMPAFVYGDSTPFPYACDYVALLDDAVTCGVRLMAAWQAIVSSEAREADVTKRCTTERESLFALAESVRRAIAHENRTETERLAKTTARLITQTTASIEAEAKAVDAQARSEAVAAKATREAAHRAAHTALEGFARVRDVPGTDVAVRLFAREGGYEAQAIVSTPWKLEAAFEAAIPVGHTWSQLRRVVDLVGALEVRVPREGWLTSSVKLRPLKLGKLTIRKVASSSARFVLTLGKGVRGGEEIELSFDPRVTVPRVVLLERGEGKKQGEPFVLGANDGTNVQTLATAIVDSARDLTLRRGVMTQAFFRGKPTTAEGPAAICQALVEAIAPTVREIGRRSGAAGEIVLRRDAGSRHRDEVYVTKAELLDRIAVLPQGMRRVFEPLELDLVAEIGPPPTLPPSRRRSSPPRLPKAARSSSASCAEISEADILAES